MRQAPQIVRAVRDIHPGFKLYVEPFCGALWSASAVMRAFPNRRFLLSDVNPYLICLWKAGAEGWNPPEFPTERDYYYYNRTRPVDDPMTGYLGFGWSFGGKFFGGPARTAGRFNGSYRSTLDKIRVLRGADVKFQCCSFDNIKVKPGSMVYLDPPYEGRTPQAKVNGRFDQIKYYDLAEKLAKSSRVIATEFLNPRSWPVLHNFGDTVVRHLNAKPKDGTVELLLRVPS